MQVCYMLLPTQLRRHVRAGLLKHKYRKYYCGITEMVT